MYPPRHNRGNPRHGYEDDITKKVKVEAPEFDGRLDPTYFLDWLANMEDFFDWYDMNDTQRIRFTKIRLVGTARTYWHTVEVTLEEQGQPPVTTWARMKMKLEETYVSPRSKFQLFSKLNNISQTSTVTY